MYLNIDANLALLLFISFTAAIKFTPEATPVTTNKWRTETLAARPTPAPSMEELRKRQILETQIPGLIVAPDSTCGILNGTSVIDWLCEARCAFATTIGHTGDMWCCQTIATGSCEKRWTACVNSASISALCTGNACDPIETLVCTDSVYAYCNRGVFNPIGVSVLYCGSTTYSADHIYQTSPILFVTAVTSTSSSSSSSSSSSISTSPTTTPTPTPTPAAKSQTPIGPIVGGAVGGVAVIAFIVVAILFFLRSKKSKHASESNNDYPPPAFVQDQAVGTQGYNPNSTPPEKPAPTFQATYAPPTASAYASQPAQHYAGQPYLPQGANPQQHYTPQGAHISQELMSTPISPRPESEIVQSPVPAYVPYVPPTDRETQIHEAQ